VDPCTAAQEVISLSIIHPPIPLENIVHNREGGGVQPIAGSVAPLGLYR
jgi:hypothetical protein